MFSLCRCKNLSLLQRKSLQQVSTMMGCAVALNTAMRGSPASHSVWATVFLACMSVLPLVAGIVIAGRYLAREDDEFVRALVVRALLWGFAITMVSDAFAGTLTNFYGGQLPWALLNVDIFFASTGLAFAFLRRSYR